MVVAGVIGLKNNNVLPKSISSLLSGKSIKYSVVDLHSIIEDGEKSLSSYLNELSRNKFELALIYIQEDHANLNRAININFDILLLYVDNKNVDFFEENINLYTNLINHLQSAGLIIINSDFVNSSKLFNGKPLHLVTYGFNSKASITASSVGDNMSEDYFLCSLQRPILDIKKRVLEPQEYKLKRLNANDYEMLAMFAFVIILGADM